MNVEYCSPVSSEGPHFPSKAARAKEAAQQTPNTENTEEYHQMMEGKYEFRTAHVCALKFPVSGMNCGH